MYNEKSKRILTDLEDGQTGVILSIFGGKKASKRLADLGLTMIAVLRPADGDMLPHQSYTLAIKL